MYQIKLSASHEVVVNGDLCRIIDNTTGRERYAGNHDQVRQWCAQHGLRGFGTPTGDADCTVTGLNPGQRVRLIATDAAGTAENYMPDGRIYVRWDETGSSAHKLRELALT